MACESRQPRRWHADLLPRLGEAAFRHLLPRHHSACSPRGGGLDGARHGRAVPTRAEAAARRYLDATRRADGAWWPLWFGNQSHPEQANPVYGTAKVVLATHDARGTAWLLEAQSADGAFPSAPGLSAAIEETAAAVEALAAVAASRGAAAEIAARARAATARGVAWLLDRTDGGRAFPAAPIGLYFAKLWYDEELYPLVSTLAALERAGRLGEDR